MLELNLGHGEIHKIEAQLLILPFYNGRTAELFCDSKLSKEEIKTVHDCLDKHFKRSDSERPALIDAPDSFSTKKMLLLNLGVQGQDSRLMIKERLAKALKFSQSTAIENAAFFLSEMIVEEGIFEACVEALLSASYNFCKYKSDCFSGPAFSLVVRDKKRTAELTKKLGEIKEIHGVVERVRDLVNEPSNILNPDEFKERAMALKKMPGLADVTVLENGELQREGLNCIHAVGKGSKKGAMLIIAKYAPKGATRKIAMVGKGITFDTGGYSLKNPKQIMHMKGDMLGAACVLEALRFAASKNSPVEIIGLMPIAENLVSENAYRPDDIIRAYNGKTVEITTTDAEGRLLLADALSYCAKFNPDEILSMATISGACHIAFGEFLAPYGTNSEKLNENMQRAYSYTGEAFTRIPLMKEYLRFIKGENADLVNCPHSSGGSLLTAQTFLSQFIVENVPWLHIDLAGVDYHEREISPYYPRGSTAFGVKTVLKYLDLI